MDIKNFTLEYYKNATEGFHIQKIEKSAEAEKLHTHKYFQIYYIEKGSLTHYVEEEMSKLYSGDMFMIPPGIKHRISEENECSFFSFSFEMDSLGSENLFNGFAIEFLKKLTNDKTIKPKITLPDEDVLRIQSIMNTIHDEFNLKKIACDDIIRAYTIVLICIFARAYYESSHIFPESKDSKKFVLHCKEYIENNYFEDICLDNMVKLSAMSKSSFCTVFKQLTGQTFNKYLNICRIRKATEYIKAGHKITAIYSFCGYNDFSTFYRNFKSIMGVTPKQYSQSKKTS